MNRLLTFILIALITACGHQPETKETNEKDSIKQSASQATAGNDKIQEKTKKANSASTQREDENLIFSNGRSREKVKLNDRTVVIIQLDPLEIEQLKEIYGEDNFYTATDDLMGYNSMMLEKMDSLGVEVKYTDKDTVDFYLNNYKQTIVKDSTFSFYTYFFFDGKEMKRTELFELIQE